MDPKRLRELASQNQAKVKDAAREKRERESQRHQTELRKQEEKKAQEQKLIEEKKAKILKQVEGVARAGGYETTLLSVNILIFSWLKWYNPFHMLTGRTSMLTKRSDDHREAVETFYLCQSLGLRPYF